MPLSLECTLKSPRPKKLLNLVQHVSVESSKIRWELLEIPPPWNSISSKCRHGSFWVDSHNNIFCAQKVGRQIWAYLWLSAIEFVMRNISLKIFCWRERHFCWEQKCFPTWGQQRSNHNMSLVRGKLHTWKLKRNYPPGVFLCVLKNSLRVPRFYLMCPKSALRNKSQDIRKWEREWRILRS